jgi:hypothetical protein
MMLLGSTIRKKKSLLVLACLITMAPDTLNGKRGDLLRIGITLFASFAIAGRNPLEVMSRAIPALSSRASQILLRVDGMIAHQFGVVPMHHQHPLYSHGKRIPNFAVCPSATDCFLSNISLPGCKKSTATEQL